MATFLMTVKLSTYHGHYFTRHDPYREIWAEYTQGINNLGQRLTNVELHLALVNAWTAIYILLSTLKNLSGSMPRHAVITDTIEHWDLKMAIITMKFNIICSMVFGYI